MPWPPTIGEPLPRAAQAIGIEEKLAAYCLNVDHEVGGAKAEGFRRILDIGVSDVEYLSGEVRAGILKAPITDVRDNAPHGVLCEVRVRITGLRTRRDRVATAVTSWELRHADDRPRLVTAYISG